jgi:hypothetical protein
MKFMEESWTLTIIMIRWQSESQNIPIIMILTAEDITSMRIGFKSMTTTEKCGAKISKDERSSVLVTVCWPE